MAGVGSIHISFFIVQTLPFISESKQQRLTMRIFGSKVSEIFCVWFDSLRPSQELVYDKICGMNESIGTVSEYIDILYYDLNKRNNS